MISVQYVTKRVFIFFKNCDSTCLFMVFFYIAPFVLLLWIIESLTGLALTFCTAWPVSLWSPQQTALNCNHHLQLNPVYRDPRRNMDIIMYTNTNSTTSRGQWNLFYCIGNVPCSWANSSHSFLYHPVM